MVDKVNFKGIQIEDNGFRYKGNSYSFEEISSIFSYYWRNKDREGIDLEVFLDSGRSIKIKASSPTCENSGVIMFALIGFDMTRENDIKKLDNISYILARNSFEKRLKRYVSDLEATGYFIFDKCKFYPAQRKILFKDKVFYLDSSDLINQANCYIEIIKNDFNALDRVKKEMSIFRYPGFDIRKDKDIIVYLLKKYFNINFYGLRMNI